MVHTPQQKKASNEREIILKFRIPNYIQFLFQAHYNSECKTETQPNADGDGAVFGYVGCFRGYVSGYVPCVPFAIDVGYRNEHEAGG